MEAVEAGFTPFLLPEEQYLDAEIGMCLNSQSRID